ncbi:MAG: endonuclease/exonuclease/phosphatase family protein [Clostridia bacterium]|nr:endonuclease/exonuclease/phosphatase family protein [Clostridia bacterium]
MDTKAEAHLSPDDNNEANGSAKESEEESPEQPGGTEIVIATFNIKYGAEGLEKIAQAISDVSPDIIGLEEVDVNCERSGNTDEPAELARLAGYPYYAFAKAIPLGGGEYGTAILSRYPIESFEVIPLESGNSEKRSVGHAVVSVDSLKLDVLVTHLSYENRSVRIEQMKTIGRMLEGFDHYVLTGDFNCFDLEEIVNLGGAYYVNRTDRRYSTFRRFEGFSPDNIVVSGDFTEFASGMSDAECSDHRLLYATFLLNVE